MPASPSQSTLWTRFLYEIYAALLCSLSAGLTAWVLAPWSGFNVTRWQAASNIFFVAMAIHIVSWICIMLMPASWRH